MAGKKRRTLTGNMLVAYNMRRARELRGLSQTEAAREAAPYLSASGEPWSRQAWSEAERSAGMDPRDDGARIRRFDADDILALSVAFDLPPAWFLTPPAPTEDGRAEELPDGAPSTMLGTDEVRTVVVGSTTEDAFEILERVLRLDDPAFMQRVGVLYRAVSDGGLQPDRRAATQADAFVGYGVDRLGAKASARHEARRIERLAEAVEQVRDRLTQQARALRSYAEPDDEQEADK